jgi:hypothetical protein
MLTTAHRFDGAALGTPYEPPPHKGALPEVQDGERVYTGSCHCGGLTVAVAAPPLDETYPHMVRECNCSSCERVSQSLPPSPSWQDTRKPS